MTKEQLLSKLEPYEQQHLVQYWDKLSEQQRNHLSQQIEAIDFAQVASLFRGSVDGHDWAELSRRANPPPAVRLEDRIHNKSGELGIKPEAAKVRGAEALRGGEVGVLITAGGQGSRLGFDKPKSLYPIGPISGASLLQIHIEKVRALAERYGVAVPVYLMTSPATHQETEEFLKKNKNFGLSDDNLLVFTQGTMPAVDEKTGQLLLSDKHELFLSPDGHGGTVKALGESGAIQHMRQRGIRQLFYLQVDNPLVPIGDKELIGYHLLAESELTSVAVAKQEPQEKLGNFAMIDGSMHVIEYSDFPLEVAEVSNSSGELKFWAGSIAVHIFEVSLMVKALEFSDTLPFHVAHKKVPYVDGNGKLIKPESPNALKFEKFIFDLLPAAKKPIVVEYAEETCFAPLKNAPGAPKDTEKYVQEMMFALHRNWLESAGAILSEGTNIEISPLFAVDEEATSQQIKKDQEFLNSQYLC